MRTIAPRLLIIQTLQTKENSMPMRSRRPCGVPGCPALTSERWCAEHAKNRFVSRSHDAFRGSSTQRGYDGEWRKIRLIALRRDQYLCQQCLKSDRPTSATEVDHIISINKAPELRLDLDNLASICGPCHKEKTNREDGGFGRAPKTK